MTFFNWDCVAVTVEFSILVIFNDTQALLLSFRFAMFLGLYCLPSLKQPIHIKCQLMHWSCYCCWSYCVRYIIFFLSKNFLLDPQAIPTTILSDLRHLAYSLTSLKLHAELLWRWPTMTTYTLRCYAVLMFFIVHILPDVLSPLKRLHVKSSYVSHMLALNRRVYGVALA